MSSTGKTPDQLKIIFKAFFEYPKTMKEVDSETSIMRENICRYVSTLRKENRIALVGYRKCRVTGSDKVGIYTTNPELFPKPDQFRDVSFEKESHLIPLQRSKNQTPTKRTKTN